MYEAKHHPPISRPRFHWRVLRHVLVAGIILITSVFLGMVGYRNFEQLSWTDAFLNAAMLLGGMGPIYAPQTEAGKLFAGFYALYAGLIFILIASIVLAPIIHRLLHKFHWDTDSS